MAAMSDHPTVHDSHTHPAQRVGLFLGPVLLAVVQAIPMPGLTPQAHTLAGVMALVITYWVTEAIPLAATALLGPALCVVLGVAGDRAAFAAFASPITFLFIGSFMLAEAMQKYGLDRRMALRLLSVPALGSTPRRLFVTLGLLTAVMSMWMSNAASTAMMLPIAISALRAWPGAGECAATRSALVLLIAFCASVGGQGTPVGTPPNLIGLGAIRDLLGIQISFVKWMMLGLPLVLVQCTFLLFRLRPATGGTDADGTLRATVLRQRAALGPLSRGEINTVLTFSLAVFFWMTPGLLDLALGQAHPLCQWLHRHAPEETVGLLAGVLLLALPVSWSEGRFTLTWREAVRIDWGTILIFAGGMAMGKMLFDTGLAKAMGVGATGLLGQPGEWTLVAVGIVLSIIVSEAASNTASATVMVPLMIAIAQGAGVDPVPVALATCLACSFGFLLPVSTGPNALAYGTGLTSIRDMMRYGFALDLVGAVTIFGIVRLVVPHIR